MHSPGLLLVLAGALLLGACQSVPGAPADLPAAQPLAAQPPPNRLPALLAVTPTGPPLPPPGDHSPRLPGPGPKRCRSHACAAGKSSPPGRRCDRRAGARPGPERSPISTRQRGGLWAVQHGFRYRRLPETGRRGVEQPSRIPGEHAVGPAPPISSPGWPWKIRLTRACCWRCWNSSAPACAARPSAGDLESGQALGVKIIIGRACMASCGGRPTSSRRAITAGLKAGR